MSFRNQIEFLFKMLWILCARPFRTIARFECFYNSLRIWRLAWRWRWYSFACRMMGEDIPLPGVLARCIKDHHPSQFPHLLSVASLISVPLNLEARTGISSLGLSARLDIVLTGLRRMTGEDIPPPGELTLCTIKSTALPKLISHALFH